SRTPWARVRGRRPRAPTRRRTAARPPRRPGTGCNRVTTSSRIPSLRCCLQCRANCTRTRRGPEPIVGWAPCVRIPARTAAARGSDLEEAGDRSVFEHFVHGPGDERGDREHGELVEDLVLA